jgi:hypothetical protein
MPRKRSADEEARETNRRMTPSERQEGAGRRPERASAESLNMPLPATGRMLQDLGQRREKTESRRAAERATKSDDGTD